MCLAHLDPLSFSNIIIDSYSQVTLDCCRPCIGCPVVNTIDAHYAFSDLQTHIQISVMLIGVIDFAVGVYSTFSSNLNPMALGSTS
jgi:hypothetical protein